MERNCILPDDLVAEILSRLPVKVLLRFRCVCKGWCALIDDADFIKKHHEVRYSVCKLDDKMAYFVDKEMDFITREYYLFSIQQGDVFTVNLTDDLKRDSNGLLPYGTDQFHIRCCGCVNGIICLSFQCRKTPLIKNCCMALWNPAIRQFMTLAFPNEQRLIYSPHFEVHGFGFDPSSRDFKIVGGYDVLHGTEIISYYVIYSLKSNSWKHISNPPADISGLPLVSSDGYLNGVYYWMIDFVEKVGPPLRFAIVSFNFTSEVFKDSNLPQDALSLVSDSYPCQMAIALYKESLALVISHTEEESLYSIHIWVATAFDNCGVPSSWQHLFTIGPYLAKLGLFVDTILVNGNLQLSFAFPHANGEDWGDREIYLYNHSKGEFKKFDFKWETCYRYVKSLFPLSERLV